ncbi:MAG: RNase H family protein [Patescibacteria group bacterium]
MIEIYMDGSSFGNPGPAGWAVAAFVGDGNDPFVTASGGFQNATSAEMEVYALYGALYLAFTHIVAKYPHEKEYRLYSDNSYVTDSFGVGQYPNLKSGWMFKWMKNPGGIEAAGKAHPKLWKKIAHYGEELYKNDITVTMSWIKAHVGHPRNEYVDQLAKVKSEEEKRKLKKKT